ncbi:hypothetical protein H8959_018758 [Pygathrix nigripes]
MVRGRRFSAEAQECKSKARGLLSGAFPLHSPKHPPQRPPAVSRQMAGQLPGNRNQRSKQLGPGIICE